MTGSSGRKRIVILGGGFGGAYCAQALERSLRGSDTEVVLIDRNNYFIFYPLLMEAGTGSLEPRQRCGNSWQQSQFRCGFQVAGIFVQRPITIQENGISIKHPRAVHRLPWRRFRSLITA